MIASQIYGKKVTNMGGIITLEEFNFLKDNAFLEEDVKEDGDCFLRKEFGKEFTLRRDYFNNVTIIKGTYEDVMDYYRQSLTDKINDDILIEMGR